MDILSYIMGQRSVGGGGGGEASDWSVATVTVRCDGLSEASQHLLIPVVFESGGMSAVMAAEWVADVIEFQIPLYKGLAIGRISNLLGGSVSVSGEITANDNAGSVAFFIRGDGTITVTGN